MPNHRYRGYSILHKAVLLIALFTWFWIALNIWVYLDYSLISLPWNYALVALAGLLVACFGSFQQYGIYFMKIGWRRGRESFLKTNFQSALIAFFVFASYFATKDNETSRLFLVFYIISFWPVLLIFNFALPSFFKRIVGFQLTNRKSLIIGSSNSINQLDQWLKEKSEYGFNFIGSFKTDKMDPSSSNIPCEGNIEGLDDYLSANRIHQLVLLPDSNSGDWIKEVSEIGLKRGCRLLIENNLSNYFDSRLVFVEEAGRQFFSLQDEPLESPFNKMIKRITDLVISIPLIVLLLPPMMIIIKLFQTLQANGPLFFKQERVGLGGELFTIWKFRSMVHDISGSRDESIQATPGDKRIFSFGLIMRRFSIDEFPQLINVVKGDMSLVGPRPYLAKHDYLFVNDYKSYRVRHFVKPGVTGPAQCRGLRGEFTDPQLIERRIELDFNYVGSWSIWLDVEILFRTIGQVLFPPKSAC